MKSLYCPVCGELVLGNAESFNLSYELRCPRCSFVGHAAGFSSKLPKHILVGKNDARCILTPSYLLAALESCPFPIERNVPLQPPLKFISEELCLDNLELPEVRAIDMREYARSIINSLLLLNSSLLEQKNKALNELEHSRRLNKFAGAMRDYLMREGNL